MASSDPPFLPVGTDVSAKYRGAFCEAKVKNLEKVVKCKVLIKETQASIIVTDDQIVNGPLKLNALVEVNLPDAGKVVEATINRLTDCSMYTVVFDDGDERTLRRTQLCLKGEKHFIESETLDNLPLSHPEHFGTPVMHGKKSKRGRQGASGSDESDESDSDESTPKRASYKGRNQDMVGKVMVTEFGDKRKTMHIPVLVVLPDASPSVEPKMKDHFLVRSFKDGKYLSISRKEMKEFTREMALKNEDKFLKAAIEKALLYIDNKELPPAWDKESLLGKEEELETGEDESSDDEPSEDKDHFIAHLYKFMDDRATPINKGPTIGNTDLNLYNLFKVVHKLGGYNRVTNQMKWRLVYSKMMLPPCNNASTQIKNAYKKFLHAFEDFYRKLGSTMGTMSRPGRSRHNSGRGILSFRGKDKEQTPTKEKDKEDSKDNDSEKESVKDLDMRTPASDLESRSELVNEIESESSTPKPEQKTPKRERGAKIKESLKEGTITTKVEKEKKDIKKEENNKRVTRKDVDEKKEEKEKEAEIKKEVEVKRGAKKSKEEQIQLTASPVKEAKKESEEEKQEQKKPGRRRSMRNDDSKKDVEDKEEDEKEVKEKEPKNESVNKEDKSSKKEDKEEKQEPTKKPVKKVKKSDADEDIASNKGEEESDSEEESSDYPSGTRLKVRYGRGRNQKEYEAKVVESSTENGVQFLVHYAGWNTRYDEWIRPERIVEIIERPDAVKKKTNKSPRTLKVLCKTKPPTKPLSPTNHSHPSLSPDVSSSIKAKSPASLSSTTSSSQSSKSRPTRSNSTEFQVLDGLPPKRRRRKTSGMFDSSTQGSDSEDNAQSDEGEVEKEAFGEESLMRDKKKKEDKEETEEVLEKEEEDTSMEVNKTTDSVEMDSDIDNKSPPLLSKITDLDKGLEGGGKNDLDMKDESFDLEPDSLEMNEHHSVVPKQVCDVVEKNDKVVHSDSTGKEGTPEVNDKEEKMVDIEENSPKADVKEKDKEMAKDKKKEGEKRMKKEFKWEVDEGLSFSKKGDIIEKGMKPGEEKTSPYKSYELESPYDFKDDPALEKDYKIRDRRKPYVLLEEIQKENKSELTKPEKCFSDPSESPPMLQRRKSFEDRFTGHENKAMPCDISDEKDLKEKAKSDTEAEKDKTPKGKKRETKVMRKTKAEKKSFQDVPEIVHLEQSNIQDIVGEPVSKRFKEDTSNLVQEIEFDAGGGGDQNEEVNKESLLNDKKKVKKKTKKKLQLEIVDELNKDKIVAKKETKFSKMKGEKGMIIKSKETVKKAKSKDSSNEKDLPEDNSFTYTKDSENADIDLRCEEKICSRSASPEPALEKKLDVSESQSYKSELPSVSHVEKDFKDILDISDSTVQKEDSRCETSSRVLLVNTPPTSPEQDESSVKDSKITEQVTQNEQIKENASSSCKEEEMDSKHDTNSQLTGGESPAGNVSPSSNRSSGSSGIVAGSEGSIDIPVSIKRHRESDDLTLPKRRKRSSHGKSLPERMRKPMESDSEEASNLSGKFSPPYSSSDNSNPKTHLSNAARNGSPRPSKYNFNLEEGKYLEGEKRITFLMEKISEMRKIYMSLKSEVASIDRRRKRLRRKEKEGSVKAGSIDSEQS
ncbi:hypothetical protein CHS0354_034576 [Potamilus streckersoni]|uniref:ARID domain-containing protein n=1 Tax=Potamilus streckersoni TaxID=2493646 RepID=A0AAE0ST75_9BIVA|nr:hypothetical protein CHS0354_034576 [Potamilus streckersoni]